MSACEIFVSNVIDNLKDRFTEKGDASILCALNKFFSPSCLVEAVEEDVVSEVVSYLCNCMAGSKSECRQEILGFVSFAKTKIESNCKVYSTSKEVVQLVLKNRAIFPILAVAAERLLVIPVSTVDCERGFSLQNLIKTDIRNSLKPANLEHLMTISIHSGEIDYEAAFIKWSKMKARRILKQN